MNPDLLSQKGLNPGALGSVNGDVVKNHKPSPSRERQLSGTSSEISFELSLESPKSVESSSLATAQAQQQALWKQYYQQCNQQYQQWMAMYHQMYAARAVQMQQAAAQSPQMHQQMLQMQMQRMPSYPQAQMSAVDWSKYGIHPEVKAKMESAPIDPELVAPIPEEPAVQEPAPAQMAADPAAPAQPARRFAELLRPALAFRLFMFYYLFCSPTLPEWQRTAFVGALIMFYMYTVDLMGYIVPGWRGQRPNQNQDLDVIPDGPDDVDNNRNDPPQGPLSRRELVERFVVGLIASLLPGWNPVR